MISHFKTSSTWSLQHLLERKLSGKLRIEYVVGSQTQKTKKRVGGCLWIIHQPQIRSHGCCSMSNLRAINGCQNSNSPFIYQSSSLLQNGQLEASIRCDFWQTTNPQTSFVFYQGAKNTQCPILNLLEITILSS